MTERNAAEEHLRASQQGRRVLAGTLLNAQDEESSRLASALRDRAN